MKEGDKCPLCEDQSSFQRIANHFDRGLSQEYTLFECAKCRGQFWLPLKNPGSKWYEHDPRYAHRNIDPHVQPNWNHRKVISFLKPKTGSASPAQRRSRALDVGCGTGNFLAWAKENGWGTYGIDFDNDAVRAAKDILGLQNVEVADLSDYRKKYPERKFDLITFFDLFEHIDNHNEFARTVSRMLNPSGHIAMSMPYRRGAKWLKPHDLPPRHLTHWDRGSLARFWERHGFKIRYNVRRSEGLKFLILKMRFKYGKFFSFNVVGKMKEKSAQEGIVKLDQKARKRIGLVHALARIKDWVLFGIPAFLIWLVMLPTSKRYITLYMIAQKNE